MPSPSATKKGERKFVLPSMTPTERRVTKKDDHTPLVCPLSPEYARQREKATLCSSPRPKRCKPRFQPHRTACPRWEMGSLNPQAKHVYRKGKAKLPSSQGSCFFPCPPSRRQNQVFRSKRILPCLFAHLLYNILYCLVNISTRIFCAKGERKQIFFLFFRYYLKILCFCNIIRIV